LTIQGETAIRGATTAVKAKDAGPARAIVRLIRTLKLETVAEGVETGAQVAHLRALGCDRLPTLLLRQTRAGRDLWRVPHRTEPHGGPRRLTTLPGSTIRYLTPNLLRSCFQALLAATVKASST
jgi:hypothetical protein